jgi:hypothetical protein
MIRKHRQQNQKLKSYKIIRHDYTITTNNNNSIPKYTTSQVYSSQKNEIDLLNEGPKYNLHYKLKNWTKTLALEAETAISYTKETEHNYLRHTLPKTFKHLLRTNIQNNTIAKQE